MADGGSSPKSALAASPGGETERPSLRAAGSRGQVSFSLDPRSAEQPPESAGDGGSSPPRSPSKDAPLRSSLRQSGQSPTSPKSDGGASGGGSSTGDYVAESRFWRASTVPRMERETSDVHDEEILFYKNMDHMDNEDIEDDLDDDPLSKALRYIRIQRDLLKSGNPQVIDEESRLKAWVEMDELMLLLGEEVMQKGVRRWIRFDMVFGLIICANGVLMGLTTQGIVDESAVWAKIVEIVFLCLFIIEWLIRWRYKPTGFRGMLADSWNLFDLMIITVSVVDAVILELLDVRSGASLILALRVLRLFRLVRLVRLVKLLKKLWQLVSGMMESFRMMCWSLLLLALFCYVFGLFMLEIVRSTDMLVRNPEAYIRWGSVMRCMLSMAEIATHNGEKLLKELTQEIGVWILLVIIVFVFVSSLGLLNLVVAVQMTSSLSLAKKDDQYDDLIQRLMKHRSLRRLRELLNERCVSTTGSVHVTRSLLMKWVHDQQPAISGGTESAGLGSQSMTPARHESKGSAAKSDGTGTASQQSEKAKAFKDDLLRGNGWDENSLSSKFTEISQFLSRQQKRKEGIARDFHEAGICEDDIKMLFDEVETVHGCDKSLPVDDFIDSCMLLKGRVHELDFVNLSQAIYCIYWRLAALQTSLTDTSRAVVESSDQVRSLLKKYHAPRKAKEEEVQDDPRDDVLVEEEATDAISQAGDEPVGDQHAKAEKEAKQKMVLRNEQEALLLNQEVKRLNEQQNWFNFDLVFSIVVIINAIVFGFEAVLDTSQVVRDIRNDNFDTMSMIWFVIDFFFLLVYMVEIVFRVIYHYQMEVQQDYRTISGVLPKLAFVMDRRTAVKILKSFPRWLKRLRNFMLLDTIVVLTGILDNIALRMIQGGTTYRKFLKLVGLLRLLRLLRLLHLVRPLSILLKAFLVNAKIIFWSLVMLLGMIYAGAIAMVQVVARDDANQGDAVIQNKWAHIGSAMLTLSEMVTYTNWGQHIGEIEKQGFFIWGSLLVFVGVTSLGILNLVVGVMVQVAFHTVVGVNTSQLTTKLSTARMHIQEAIDRAFAKEGAKVQKRKDDLQMRVMMMRQDVLETNVNMEAKERERLLKSGSFNNLSPGGARLRRSVGKDMGTRNQLLGAAHDENEEDDEENDPYQQSSGHKKPKSMLNARNHCTVVHCFWTADGELAVGISSVEDPNRQGQLRDPMQAALVWDGGRMNPTLFIAEDDENNALNDFGVEKRQSQVHGQKEAKPDAVGVALLRSGKRFHRHGNLFYGEVPMGTDLHFQYGNNYSLLRVYPVKSTLTWDDQILLADVLPVDQEVLTIVQLRVIMQDPLFIRNLGKINLRAEQALMTYSVLNVVSTGRVRVVDFIDGLLRLRRQDVGLDTAGAKSLLRRLMVQVTQLAKDSVMCNMCFSQAVQKLRGVSILEQDDENGDTLTTVDADSVVFEYQNKLAKDNEKFKMKLQRLHDYVDARKAQLEINGDLGFGRGGALDDRDDDENSVAMSITSASPGWD